MAFRLYDQRPQYRLNSGALCADGTLSFFENETTTPKDVFSNPGLSVNIGPVVDLESDGRSDTDIWLDGVYSVTLKDSLGAEVWALDNVRDADTSDTVVIPPATDGEDGWALLTDGLIYYLAAILTVPDPTGQVNKILSNDGSVLQWIAQAAAVVVPTGGVAIASGEVRLGTLLVKYGTDTAPAAASSLTTTKAVTFSGTAYTAYTGAIAMPSVGAVTPQGAQVSSACTSGGTGGFTASFFAGAENTGAGSDKITSSVPFFWIAVGTCVAP